MISQEEHYAMLLGLGNDWKVTAVDLDMAAMRVDIHIEYDASKSPPCPECGKTCRLYDYREMRQWRHLDTMQFQTVIHCEVPRSNCSEHGVKTIKTPWAGKGSHFTLLFEGFAIKVLECCTSISRAAGLLGLNWHQVNEIKRRAVARGLERRKETSPRYLGIDEKNFGRGHSYVSVLTDIDNSRVLDVTEGRDEDAANALLGTFNEKQLKGIKAVAMDMWKAYIKAVNTQAPDATIVHDRFHISKHLNEAVDRVRKQEHRELMKEQDERLKGSKYLWLTGFENMSDEMRLRFDQLQAMGLKVGRAHALKETFDYIWLCRDEDDARAHFKDWFGWARRSKLEPMKRVSLMLKRHLNHIVTYITHRISNAAAEGFNAVIQSIKANARGFRNFENYRVAILFQCGKLDLHP